LATIKDIRKKIEVLREFGFHCTCCNAGIEILPALSFHHPNPSIKTVSWRKIKRMSLKDIIMALKKDRAVILCSNCHNYIHSTILNEYESIILHEDLFRLTPEQINEKVMGITADISGKIERMHKREKIKQWIKKRFIIKSLFNDRCVACGIDNLSYQEFHHTDPNLKEEDFKWSNIRSLDTLEIIDKIVKQKCVCLCSNCHSLIHSKISEYIDEVMEKIQYETSQKERLIKTIKRKVEKIHKNIADFKILNNRNQFRDPLKLELPHTDLWKHHLVKLYNYSHRGKKTFKAYDLQGILSLTVRHIYKHLNRFIEMGYLERVSRGVFKFTKNGVDKIHTINK